MTQYILISLIKAISVAWFRGVIYGGSPHGCHIVRYCVKPAVRKPPDILNIKVNVWSQKGLIVVRTVKDILTDNVIISRWRKYGVDTHKALRMAQSRPRASAFFCSAAKAACLATKYSSRFGFAYRGGRTRASLSVHSLGFPE